MSSYHICNWCAKDNELQQFIEQHGHSGRCPLCTMQRTCVIPTHQASNLFKALIRKYYGEVQYNPLLGNPDASLPTLLRKENHLLRHNTIDRAYDEDDSFSFERFIEELTSPPWPDESTREEAGVWLYAERNPTPGLEFYRPSLREQHDPRISDLEQSLEDTNYYTLEEEWKYTLQNLLARVTEIIPIGRQFYRARIGVDAELDKVDYQSDYVVRPYSDSQIGAPPQSRATSGRLNRANVSYLYVADNSPTAIAEVRPHPGHVVSVGKFMAEQELRVASLANVRLLPFAINERGLEDFVLLKTIEGAFATPVTPDDPIGYMATQFLADIIRQLGYIGVTYRSSISDGTNLTIFEPKILAYVPGSAQAQRVTKVKYSSEPVPVDLSPEED